MTDKPILFKAPMVRALLDGTKTQTRRILKPRWGLGEPQNLAECGIDADTYSGKPDDPKSWGWPCAEDGINDMSLADWPHASGYAVGDRLWVKETWRTWRDCDRLPPNQLQQFGSPICYEADTENTEPKGKVRVSIHMPRWASRLTLTVTDVRVERLQDISAADAKAEGAQPIHNKPGGDTGNPSDGWISYPDGYQRLWNSINGAGAWEQNPWVVALTFTVEQRNIDAGKASVA